MDITTTPEWAALLATPRPAHLRHLFAADPGRADRYLATAGDLRVDYSKHLIDDVVLAALLTVARTAGVAGSRDAMFAGERINTTEQRAVLHLKLWENLTFAQIAEALDISPHTAASRYRYALDKLRDVLRPVYEERL